MKIDNLRKSKNIDDRRGQPSYGTSRGSVGGGALLSILFSRGFWKSKLLMIFLLVLLGGGGTLSGNFTDGNSQSYQSNQITKQKDTTVSDAEFVNKVSGSTEDYWNQQFQAEGYGN